MPCPINEEKDNPGKWARIGVAEPCWSANNLRFQWKNTLTFINEASRPYGPVLSLRTKNATHF